MHRAFRGKRIFDVFFSGLGLILLTPFSLAVAALIKLQDGGPVIFRQERVGRRGEPFLLLKFRTMKEKAEQEGPRLTVGADERITPIGHYLRRFKLDELPQLVNVLRGEMSLVGPRPEVPEYVALYTPEQRAVLELTPGITDPASIKYRNENELLAASDDPVGTYVNEIMPDKIRLNLEYEQQATLLTDFGVIVRTVLPFCAR